MHKLAGDAEGKDESKGEGRGSQPEEGEPQTLPRGDEAEVKVQRLNKTRKRKEKFSNSDKDCLKHEVVGGFEWGQHPCEPTNLGCLVALDLQRLQKQDHPPIFTPLRPSYSLDCKGGFTVKGVRGRGRRRANRAERGSSVLLYICRTSLFS